MRLKNYEVPLGASCTSWGYCHISPVLLTEARLMEAGCVIRSTESLGAGL